MNSTTLLALLFFLIPSIALKAQDQKVDSLKILLNTVPEQEQAMIYNVIASNLYYVAPDSCIVYADKALAIAEKFNLPTEKYFALVHKGVGYSILNKNQQAVSFHLQALELAIGIADKKKLGRVHNELGIDYKYLGKFDKSLEHLLKALSIKEEKPADGISLFSERSIANTMNNIGTIYDNIGDFDRALDYYYKVLEIRKSSNDRKGEASVLNNIGIVFEEKGKFHEALDYYRQSLEIKMEIGNERSIATTLGNIGIIYLDLGDYKNALKYHFETLEINKETGNLYGIANISNSIADIYLEKGEPQKAYPYIMDGLKYAKQSKARRIESDSYNFLSKYYKAVNNDSKAYETQLLLMALKDSLFSLELTEQVAEMQTRYETEKKEKEIEILARDKEIQSLKIRKQSVQLYVLLGFIFLAMVISILVFGRIKLKQQQVRTELEKKNLETEQRLLRSQMNPHFIFNSMNSIQSFISGNDSFTAMTYLSKFAQLMRNILENSRKPFICLSEEINTLELYMELERMRFKQKFDYKITIEPGLPIETAYIPPMLIQPFVENSIKHGLRNKKDKGLLEIEFSQKHKFINCVVKDNGVGRKKAMEMNKEKNTMPDDRQESHQSLGMLVTRERLDALSKEKKININFNITDLKDKNGKAEGTQVVIQMPFEID